MVVSRIKHYLVGTSLVAIAAIAIYLAVVYRSDSSMFFSYAAYADLQNDRGPLAVELLEFVPQSATRITGWNDVESNSMSVEFSFAKMDLGSVTRTFTVATASDRGLAEKALKGRSWKGQTPSSWPDVQVYSGNRGGNQYLMIDTRRWRAFYVVEPIQH